MAFLRASTYQRIPTVIVEDVLMARREVRKWTARAALGIIVSPIVYTWIYGNIESYRIGVFSGHYNGPPANESWLSLAAIVIAYLVDMPIVFFVIVVLVIGFLGICHNAFPNEEEERIRMQFSPEEPKVSREMTEGELAQKVLGDEYFA
jgi:hypothetical protein